jgi:hypothetical protein
VTGDRVFGKRRMGGMYDGRCSMDDKKIRNKKEEIRRKVLGDRKLTVYF